MSLANRATQSRRTATDAQIPYAYPYVTNAWLMSFHGVTKPHEELLDWANRWQLEKLMFLITFYLRDLLVGSTEVPEIVPRPGPGLALNGENGPLLSKLPRRKRRGCQNLNI